MMTPDQYWDWYWTNVRVWLPVTIPMFLAAAVWSIVRWWADRHEDDPPKDHFIKLF